MAEDTTDDTDETDRVINQHDISKGAVFHTEGGITESVFHVDEGSGTVLTVMEQDIDTLVEWLNSSNAEYVGVNEELQALNLQDFEEA